MKVLRSMLKKAPLLLLLFPQLLLAQYPIETDPATGKKGMPNPYNGEVIIPFDYDEIYPVIGDSIFVVKTGSKWGVLDKQLKMVVPPTYAYISFVRPVRELPCVFAKVHDDGKTENRWGLLDRRGKLVLPMQFKEIWPIFPDLVAAQYHRDSVLHFFDETGRELFTQTGKKPEPGFDHNSVKIKRGGAGQGSYFIQKNGQKFFDGRVHNLLWTNGNLIVKGNSNGKVGMVNSRGDTIFPFNNEAIRAFNDGNFLLDGGSKIQALGNSEGKILIPFGNHIIKKWTTDPASVYTVSKGNRWENLHDSAGKLLLENVRVLFGISGDFTMPSDERKWTYLRVGQEESNLWGFFRADGSPILPVRFNEVQYFTEKHPILTSIWHPEVSSKNRMQAWDFEGKSLLPDRFYKLRFTRNPQILIACEAETSLWGFLDLKKPEAVKFEFELINDLGNGYFSARNAGHFRLFDLNLREIKIEHFSNVTGPVRAQFDRFRAQKLPGKLVAIGYRPDDPKMHAINDQGKSFHLDLLPAERVMSDGLGDAIGSGKVGSGQSKDVEMVVEQPPPPADKVDEVAEATAYPAPKKAADTQEIFERPQVKARFPGGEEALFKFMKAKTVYPAIAKDNGIEGKVVLKFVVEKDGAITDIKIIRDIGGGCGAAAVKMVGLMPNWLPATTEEKRVRSFMTLSVPFPLR